MSSAPNSFTRGSISNDFNNNNNNNNNNHFVVGTYPNLAPLVVPPPSDIYSNESTPTTTNTFSTSESSRVSLTSETSQAITPSHGMTPSVSNNSLSRMKKNILHMNIVESTDLSLTESFTADQTLSESFSPRRNSGDIEMDTLEKKDDKDKEESKDKADLESNKFDLFDPYNEKIYTLEEVGWKGKKTAWLIFQRYIFGLIVAVFVSLAVFVMAQIDWTGPANSSLYLNRKSFSVFFQFSIILFGPIYIVLEFTVSYGIKRMINSKLLFYSIGIIFFITIFFMILYLKGVNYWYYFIDAIGVCGIFVVVEVIFAYTMSIVKQGETGQVDKKKAYMIAYNYCAPDIIVTLCTVIYMFFLLPVYFSINNDILRLGWRLVIHPLYWTAIVVVARQFLMRDISTDDIMLNTNIVLHTFFHHQTLGKIFVYTFSGDASYLTEVGMVVAAIEDIILRAISLKRDEWVLSIYYGREKARQIVYSQQSLQLRAAILNIQVALEFSGLISAPIFIYLFQEWKMLFHFFDSGAINPVTLFYQSLLSIGLDLIAEFICTYIECRYFKLPLEPTWKWMKNHKWFLTWLMYGSVTMGLLGMLWTCARVPRIGLCSSDDICTCNQIISSSIPEFCTQQ